MPDFKLSYFNFHGGRGESVRLAMHIGGLEFEDHRIDYTDWAKHKPSMPLQSVPVLCVDNNKLTQSNAILRYVGKLASLYPEDVFQAALCDEALDIIEDISHAVVPTMMMNDEAERKSARENLAAGPLPLFFGKLQDDLQAHGGKYFSDNRLTIADLKVFVVTRWLRSGALDYIPTDMVDKVAPLLVAHAERMAAHPDIKAYYEKFAS